MEIYQLDKFNTNQIIRLGALLVQAGFLDYSLEEYTKAGLNKQHDNVWLWSENEQFTLYSDYLGVHYVLISNPYISEEYRLPLNDRETIDKWSEKVWDILNRWEDGIAEKEENWLAEYSI